MSSVTFAGLASGVDTASVVTSLMEIERAPITAMEDKQEYLETKLDTYEEFNTLLDGFYSAVIGLNSKNDLNAFEVTNNGSEYFSIKTTSLATEGNYSIEIVSLAQKQKDVSSDGIADTDTTTLSGELVLGEETLSYEDVTLFDLLELINDGEYGVTASIIDDGTGEGYRLMLITDTAGEEMEITGTGSIIMDTATDGHTVDGSKAHVIVDGVDYYSSSNTVTTALKGATITLMSVSDSGADNVAIASDADTIISTQMEELVTAYNEINTYITTIKASDSTLANTMASIQRSLKNYLTSSDFSSLGIESDWETGELSFDSEVFATAYAEDPDAITLALLGDDDTEGVMTRLDDYLNEQLNKTSGFLVTKKSTIDKTISRLDDSIALMETRLEKRQETLEAQFTAMETLVSSLNSMQEYLTSYFDSEE
ncbi:MAG: flagellar filament capping protein FliD [Chlorobium sp.]|jgi:flagellar hook-associated protein 2|nr:flagellar filament capping protein FliD [Chlorobium sp.]